MVDRDDRDPGRALPPAEKGKPYASRLQILARLCPEWIIADAGDDPRLGAQPCRGRCLIRTLPAVSPVERPTDHCLARMRKARDTHDEIHIHRPNDDDGLRHEPNLTAGRRTSRTSCMHSARASTDSNGRIALGSMCRHRTLHIESPWPRAKNT